MSGLQVQARADGPEAVIAPGHLPAGAARVVSCPAGAALLKLEYRGVQVFLSMGRSVIDLDAVLTSPTFDVRHAFISAVPLVMYVRWAFGPACWNAPVASACLVIDDPLLKPRYGALEFANLLDLMQTHDFATSIAFIPWNWRRSVAKVVRLFKANPARLSLSVHGCDHTAESSVRPMVSGWRSTRLRRSSAWPATNR